MQIHINTSQNIACFVDLWPKYKTIHLANVLFDINQSSKKKTRKERTKTHYTFLIDYFPSQGVLFFGRFHELIFQVKPLGKYVYIYIMQTQNGGNPLTRRRLDRRVLSRSKNIIYTQLKRSQKEVKPITSFHPQKDMMYSFKLSKH